MGDVVQIGAGMNSPSTDEFATDLGQACGQALKRGAQNAVLVFFDGASVHQIPVRAAHPLARGMMEEAAEYWQSRCAGVEA